MRACTCLLVLLVRDQVSMPVCTLCVYLCLCAYLCVCTCLLAFAFVCYCECVWLFCKSKAWHSEKNARYSLRVCVSRVVQFDFLGARV
jgi:uncharacterized membrane protein YjgN (DUF898 family)